jgi:hypothetical protein
MDDGAYQALLSAIRAIPPAERQQRVDRALKELEEAEWRDVLKGQFAALSTPRWNRY